MDQETVALFDKWAFNVALEAAGREEGEAMFALGGDVLSLHELDKMLQAIRPLVEAARA